MPENKTKSRIRNIVRRRGKDGKVARAFHEVYSNTPSTVRRADVSGKRKRKMMTAIALEKARKAGVNIPRRS